MIQVRDDTDVRHFFIINRPRIVCKGVDPSFQLPFSLLPSLRPQSQPLEARQQWSYSHLNHRAEEANGCICHISNDSLYHHSTLAWELWRWWIQKSESITCFFFVCFFLTAAHWAALMRHHGRALHWVSLWKHWQWSLNTKCQEVAIHANIRAEMVKLWWVKSTSDYSI